MDKKEFKVGVQNNEAFKGQESRLLDIFSELDANKNDSLEFEEFVEMIANVHRMNLISDKLFSVTSADGKNVTMDDLVRINKDTGSHYTQSDLELMMRFADENGDRKIVKDEFLHIMEQGIKTVGLGR